MKGTSYQLGKNNFNLHKMIVNNKKTFNIVSFAQTYSECPCNTQPLILPENTPNIYK